MTLLKDKLLLIEDYVRALLKWHSLWAPMFICFEYLSIMFRGNKSHKLLVGQDLLVSEENGGFPV